MFPFKLSSNFLITPLTPFSKSRIAGILHILASREVVLSHGYGEIFPASFKLGVLVIYAVVLLALVIFVHRLLGYTPAHEVEETFSLHGFLKTHLRPQSLTCIVLRPPFGRIKPDFIFGIPSVYCRGNAYG